MQINTFYTAYSVYFRWFHIGDMLASGSGTIYEQKTKNTGEKNFLFAFEGNSLTRKATILLMFSFFHTLSLNSRKI